MPLAERISEFFTRPRLRSLLNFAIAFLILVSIILFVFLLVKVFINVLNDNQTGCFSEFYQRSCEMWTKREQNGSSDKPVRSVFSTNVIETEVEIALLSTPPPHVEEDNVITKLKLMYNVCLKENLKDGKALKSLKNYLSMLGGWPLLQGGSWKKNMRQAMSIVGRVWRKFGSTGLFKFYVIPNIRFSKNPTLLVGIPDFDPFPTFIPMGLRAASPVNYEYVRLMLEVAAKLKGKNLDTDRARWDASETADFMTFMQSLSRKSSGKKAVSYTHIRQLSHNLKLDLYPMFKSLTADIKNISEWETILVHDEKYTMRKLANEINRVGPRTVVNLAIWHVIFPLLWHTNKQMRDISEKLRNLQGHEKPMLIQRKCLLTVTELYPYATARCHANKYFQDNDILTIDKITNNIRQSYIDSIVKSKWLSSRSKIKTTIKMAKIHFEMGYPKWIKNDESFRSFHEKMVVSTDHFSNIIHAREFFTVKHLEELNNVLPQLWPVSPLTVNAMYLPFHNQVVIYGGLIRSVKFHSNISLPESYGLLGSIIGHEIGHSLDTLGIQLDYHGDQVAIFDKASSDGYFNRIVCLIKQYSDYCPFQKLLTGICVDGQATLNENIADNLGTRMTFLAFKKHLQTREKWEVASNNVLYEGYSPMQQFFIAYSSLWCPVDSRERVEYQIDHDIHSPKEYRSVGPLSNMKEFSDLFQCKLEEDNKRKSRCLIF